MFGRRSAPHLARFSLDSLAAWAVAAAIVFIALIVAGVLPRIPWWGAENDAGHHARGAAPVRGL